MFCILLFCYSESHNSCSTSPHMLISQFLQFLDARTSRITTPGTRSTSTATWTEATGETPATRASRWQPTSVSFSLELTTCCKFYTYLAQIVNIRQCLFLNVLSLKPDEIKHFVSIIVFIELWSIINEIHEVSATSGHFCMIVTNDGPVNAKQSIQLFLRFCKSESGIIFEAADTFVYFCVWHCYMSEDHPDISVSKFT